MKSVTVHFKAELAHYTFEVRDSSTGLMLAELQFASSEITAAFHARMRGEDPEVPARLQLFDAPNIPTHRETCTKIVEAVMLPQDRDSRAIVVAELLRPYETHGWRGNPVHVGDRNRIERQLPDGRILYRVDFERFIPEAAR